MKASPPPRSPRPSASTKLPSIAVCRRRAENSGFPGCSDSLPSKIVPLLLEPLFEPFTDADGNLSSRPVLCDGQPVQCREAVERRDRMIEHLASLAPVQG